MKLWHRWVAWCAREEDPRPLALVRIFTSLVILFDLLLARAQGLLPVLWLPIDAGGITTGANRWYLQWGLGALLGPEAGGVFAWFGAVTCAILAASGLYARPAMLGLLVFHAQLAHLNDQGDRAIDHLLRTVLLLLVFSGSHLRFTPWGPRVERCMAWPSDLLRFILVLMYTGAGLAKVIAQPAWVGFPAVPVLYRIMADPMVAHLDPHLGQEWYGTLRFFGWGTIALELAAPLIFTRWRRWWALGGIGMHLGIAATIDIGVFSYGMLGLYPVLLWREKAGRAEAGRPAKEFARPIVTV